MILIILGKKYSGMPLKIAKKQIGTKAIIPKTSVNKKEKTKPKNPPILAPHCFPRMLLNRLKSCRIFAIILIKLVIPKIVYKIAAANSSNLVTKPLGENS